MKRQDLLNLPRIAQLRKQGLKKRPDWLSSNASKKRKDAKKKSSVVALIRSLRRRFRNLRKKKLLRERLKLMEKRVEKVPLKVKPMKKMRNRLPMSKK